MARTHDRRVVACIPYYRCHQYVRRAVKSLLAQTHPDLTVVVVNDADFETPPWPALADISDTRLVRFDLARNRGLYFANAVVLGATNAPYFLVQDADDWSAPERVQRLLAALIAERSDFAVCAEVQFRETDYGKSEVMGVRFQRRTHQPVPNKSDTLETFCTRLDPSYRFRVCHHALFRRGVLTAVGGYYAGFRQHFDTLLVNLLLMVGRLSHVEERLYWRLHWPGALTKRPETGIGSAVSRAALARGERLYGWAYDWYHEYLRGNLGAVVLMARIRQICAANVTAEDRAALAEESSRLRHLIESRHY